MSITVTINLNGIPLARTYVSHYDFWRISNQTIVRRTSSRGTVSIPNVNGSIKLKVHAQNAVVRILEGDSIYPNEVSHTFEVRDGSTININRISEKSEYFEKMNECQKVYDSIFRRVSPFNKRGRGAYPFRRGNTYSKSKSMGKLDLIYPDSSPSEKSWVEPVSLNGYPLIHLKANPSIDTIAHEMAHALYFVELPIWTRTIIEARYLSYIVSREATGRSSGHASGVTTSPFIAWIESFGMLSSRLYKLKRENYFYPWSFLQTEFIKNEKNYIGLDNDNNLIPNYQGDDVEGAIYGAIFVDLGERIGLSKMISIYIRSGQGNILEFDDFKDMLIHDYSYDEEIIEVAKNWGL